MGLIKPQAKVHEELDRVVGRGNPPRLEHCGDLHFVNAVLTETLRKAAVAPSGLPHYVTGNFFNVKLL
jgi:cytochrome P450 family 2 subfamily C